MVNPVFVEEFTPSLIPHCARPGTGGPLADALVADYTYLCRRASRKFWRTGLEHCDLEQVAAIGLIKAARRFDASSTTPFEAYAWLTIVGELGHYVRDHERLVRVPRRLRALEPAFTHARDACVGRLGREPRDAEIAREMGVLEGIVSEVRAAVASRLPLSLDDTAARGLTCDGTLALEDRLLVTEAFARLSEVERRVIVGVYVLGISQLELGRTLGLSPRRVSRVRSAALRSMQRNWAG